MAAPREPAQKGERWRLWATGAILFSFCFLALSAVGELGVFPHRYAPLATDFDTGFMVLAEDDHTPLAITWGESSDEMVGSAPITIQNLTFFSERFDNVDVRISAAIVRPRTAGPPAPALVVVHGYGGSRRDMMPVARALASSGYVAIAIDAPDSGQSTPYPRRTPENLVNVTPDPRGGFFFHVAYAASRALSVLETLPYVNDNALGVLGASQGGIVTLYLAAKDPRVRAAVPIIPGGNLEEAFYAPSFVHLLVPRDVTPTDPRAVAFRRYYDPLGYAPLIRAPTLFMAGTNDEFFPLWGVVATYDAIPAQAREAKWLSLVPNLGHGAYDGWTATVERFLASVFRAGPALPSPAIRSVSSDRGGVHVTATAPPGSQVVLVFRESTAGDRWRWVPMAASGTDYTGTANPTWPGQASLYVAVMDGTVFVTATPVVAVEVTGYTGPVLLVFTALLAAYLLGTMGIRYRDRLIPLAAALLSTAGSSIAWVGMYGRASWGWYEIADRTNLGSVLFAAFLLFYAGLITAALLRPRKMLLLSWIPVVFSLTVYATLAALFGSVAPVGPSWGFVAILASPLLVLVERRWKKEPRLF